MGLGKFDSLSKGKLYAIYTVKIYEKEQVIGKQKQYNFEVII